MKIALLIVSCFILFIGAAWDSGEGLSPNVKWSSPQGVKWQTDGSVFEESPADAPDEGWYRYGTDYPVPDSWPGWAKERFVSLSSGMTEEDRKHTETWEAPGLKTDTLWVDAKADKLNGSIQVSVPNFQHFTYVLIDPPAGVVDQDFAGKAKIYSLDADQTYRISAWDATGLLGLSLTALSDNYIHVLPDSYDNLGGRIPVMAQKVVEDPNRDLWVSVYQPVGLGALYQFVDIYSLKAEGDIRSKFRVPLTTSYIRPWLADILLENNGDVVFSACEDPMGLSAFLGPSYVARLEKTGTTVWETASNQLSSAICIAPLGDGGYVYGGATFSTDPLYLDKQFGRLYRLTSAGGHTPWGVSGTTYVNSDYSVRDIKRSTDNFYYLSGRNNTGGPRLFAPIQSEGYPSSAVSVEDPPFSNTKCAEDMDGDLVGHDFSGEGGCGYALVGCGWDRGANQTAVKSKVWYHTTVANTITLQYNDGAWQTIGSIVATADGATHLWEADFAAVTATNWRVTFSTTVGPFPCGPWLVEWQLYPASTGGGVVAKYALSGVTGGTEMWNTLYLHPESLAGIFNSVVISPRDTSRIYGFGSTEHSTVNLSINKGMALCVNPSGATIWQKDYSQVSEFYDAAATEDGGFLLAGTIYTGTSVQARSAVIMKIDKDGNVDTKFPQTFKDPSQLGNDGRGIIETRDGGILMVGGNSDPVNRSQPYIVKLDRFYRPCSSGIPCE